MTDTDNMNLILQAKALIPSALGDLEVMAYSVDAQEHMPHLVIAHPQFQEQDTVTIRIHSECITGDIFGSKRCDCGEQLAKALHIISEEKGMLIYLRQEGRGIGIINKLKAYNLQDEGLNTVDANTHMGFQADARDYSVAIEILQDLDIQQINLLTNNPEKINTFTNSSVKLINAISLEIEPNSDNIDYLKTKKDVMGHLLKL